MQTLASNANISNQPKAPRNFKQNQENMHQSLSVSQYGPHKAHNLSGWSYWGLIESPWV